jgi:hypothetical protein
MLDFTLKLIKLADCVQRNPGHLAFIGSKQLEELAPGVCPAACFKRLTTVEQRLITGITIDHQGTAPALKHITGILTTAPRLAVIKHN